MDLRSIGTGPTAKKRINAQGRSLVMHVKGKGQDDKYPLSSTPAMGWVLASMNTKPTFLAGF